MTSILHVWQDEIWSKLPVLAEKISHNEMNNFNAILNDIFFFKITLK